MDEYWGPCERKPSRSTATPRKLGGARRDRTDDLLLAKQALSQLSYGPGEISLSRKLPLKFANARCETLAWKVVGLGRLELPTSRLSSARSNQLSYKPKNPLVTRDLEWSEATYGPRPAGLHRRSMKARHGLVHEERET